MTTQTGRRVYPGEDGVLSLAEGDYGFRPGYGWIVRPPGCNAGGIPKHDVIEHEDGTITVSPSILLSEADGEGGWKQVWHGWLERGIWRTA